MAEDKMWKKGFNIIRRSSLCINGLPIISFSTKMDFKHIFICDEFSMYLDKIRRGETTELKNWGSKSVFLLKWCI